MRQCKPVKTTASEQYTLGTHTVLGSLRSHDDCCNEKVTLKENVGLVAGNERSALSLDWHHAANYESDWSQQGRAARTYEDVRAVLFKRTTLNYHIYRFDDNLNIQL